MSRQPLQISEIILENFRPLSGSIDWRLGTAYYFARGTQAFVTHEVPNQVINDGRGAARAAETLFRHCEELGAALEPELRVLELAVGLGLHARILLDRFRALCRAAGRDYYDRLTFFATDLSPRTLADLVRLETFAEHAPRVRLGFADAREPGTFRGRDGELVPLAGTLRAVFHNYLFDVLPADVIAFDGSAWRALHVETRLGGVERLADRTPLSLDAVLELASTGDANALAALVPLRQALRFASRFEPVDVTTLPRAAELQRFVADVLVPAGGLPVALVHSHGALDSLEATLAALRPDGFVVYSDYGASTLADVRRGGNYQRYGGSTSIAVDFVELEHALAQHPSPAHVSRPEGDEGAPLHVRLVSRAPLAGTHAAFRAVYDRKTFAIADELVRQAAQATARRDLVAAKACYEDARAAEPWSWAVLRDYASFAMWQERSPARAIELCREALALNSFASPELWNELGDALFALGDRHAAQAAFERALAINPESTRAHFNQAWTLAARGDLGDALASLGRALACDKDGTFRARILAKQRELLELQSAAWNMARMGRGP